MHCQYLNTHEPHYQNSSRPVYQVAVWWDMIQFPPLNARSLIARSFPSVIDFCLGLIFVLMVLAPAIVASLHQASWQDEDN